MNSISPNIPDYDLASLCKAAGDSLRLDILRTLARDSYGVLELAEIFRVKQSLMSHHLKILAQVNLVSSRREGNSIFYRRAPLGPQDPWMEFKVQLFAAADQTALTPEQQQGLQHIHRDRANASAAFFIENSAKFRAQQDLIASYNVYASTLSQLLLNSPFPDRHNVLEVGPGEGEFLPVLRGHFSRVTALDNSPVMLEKARQYAQNHQVNDINFICGDTNELTRQGELFDCAVINMVLHHVPSPAQLIQQVAQVLVPKGILLMTDLCRHEQHWAKQTCGDLWMGFDPEDLFTWAQAAGLATGQSSYLALRNGFQIQLHQFTKS